MKRYAFSLRRVLRVRAAQETVARQALRAAADHAAAARDDNDVKYRQYQAAVAGAATFRGTALNLLAMQDAAARRAREVVAADKANDAAQAQLVEARGAWSATEQRVQTLEHLDEREKARYQAALQHAEQVVVDDVVSGRAARRTAEGAQGEGVR